MPAEQAAEQSAPGVPARGGVPVTVFTCVLSQPAPRRGVTTAAAAHHPATGQSYRPGSKNVLSWRGESRSPVPATPGAAEAQRSRPDTCRARANNIGGASVKPFLIGPAGAAAILAVCVSSAMAGPSTPDDDMDRFLNEPYPLAPQAAPAPPPQPAAPPRSKPAPAPKPFTEKRKRRPLPELAVEPAPRPTTTPDAVEAQRSRPDTCRARANKNGGRA